MAIKKTNLSKPSKLSKGFNLKIRFDFKTSKFGIYTNKKKLAYQNQFIDVYSALDFLVSQHKSLT